MGGITLTEFSPTDGTTQIYNYNSQNSVNQNTYSMTHVLGPITIQGGVAFDFAIAFGVASRIFSGPASSQNTMVTANFLNTMLLTGLELRDSTNTVVAFNSSNFQTTSGASYAPNGVTPEPGSSMLLLAGLVVLGTARFTLRST